MTLKPCPFCGGTAHPVEYHPIAHRVVCPSCDARGGKGASEAEAAEKWNCRASYAAHMPAVMAATEPEELARPLVMAEPVEATEAPCRTCRHYMADRTGRHRCVRVYDADVWRYQCHSGALTSITGLPTDLRMTCPGWAPKEPT